MIGAVYIEREIAGHPRALEILARLPDTPRVPIDRYGEVFNRRAQNFRLQKRRPSLILARKHERHVLPTPAGYGVGGSRNYYFSHMLNCLYDCRYCFLQGMYRSAHEVVFVNYEDFFDEIESTSAAAPREPTWFFSGYDCDSLAFEGVTGFVAAALPRIRAIDNAWLELRTKSTRIRPLLEAEPFERCVVAWSFTPAALSAALEGGVPTVERRLEALRRVQERGWPLGLRFDPLLDVEDFEIHYRELFEQVFAVVDPARLHSVSLGPFRLPTGFFHRVERLYPDEPLLAGSFEDRGGMVSYRREREAEMVRFCEDALRGYVDEAVFFPCRVDAEAAA